MKMIIEKGDLFGLDNKYALCHCVSADCDDKGSWGAGIVIPIKKRFKGAKEYCAEVIKKDNLSYPCAILFDKQEQKLINLITKPYFYTKPTYSSIHSAIHKMLILCEENNIKYLGMPMIGCGIDGLEWDKVQKIVESEFKDSNVEIVVRYLDENSFKGKIVK